MIWRQKQILFRIIKRIKTKQSKHLKLNFRLLNLSKLPLIHALKCGKLVPHLDLPKRPAQNFGARCRLPWNTSSAVRKHSKKKKEKYTKQIEWIRFRKPFWEQKKKKMNLKYCEWMDGFLCLSKQTATTRKKTPTLARFRVPTCMCVCVCVCLRK